MSKKKAPKKKSRKNKTAGQRTATKPVKVEFPKQLGVLTIVALAVVFGILRLTIRGIIGL